MSVARVDEFQQPTRPWIESERSTALHAYGVLDTPREAEFDELAQVASDICGAPIAVVNLVDTTRQFFKAEVGLGVRSTPLESAICAHALLEEDVMVIPDATKDPRLECNPLVTEAPHLRAYAGALLKTADGLPIGTICVLDYRPREFTDAQIKMLRFLARQTMAQLELRRQISEQRRLLARARRAENEKANFERLVRQASDFIGMADKSGQVVFLNDAARAMLGLSPDEAIPSKVEPFIAEEDRQAFRDEVVPVIRAGESCDRELRLRNIKTGETFPALYTMFPIRGADNAIVGYGVVTKDISEQKAEEERRAHIISEAAHRMKNTLAIVEAIVSQTLRNATTLEEGRNSISKRVRALAQAQDILSAAEGSAADIVKVIENALTPHDPGAPRLKFTGPSHPLSAAQSLGLSLAIHELATNAAKYGALKGDTGNVEIAWTVSDAGDFCLEWKESAGFPVMPPTTSGFGSKLIQRLVAPYFGGTAVHEFLPNGVRFTLEGKLPSRDMAL
ncbi:PAS domain S-box-containing protein [Neorhizobium huautlense]|uniref:Blue-light-activated histidine kinase n=1 Tax=Neorhizobium huautlense TaxID=67774 RepID=A0ABT9Q1A6_9HYPH|nr:HWE histidine kinase domain-containing protein [Neorhizobium huautlense]MDP9840503.1 PAS domain S-box-containing protein [Neorhizobium huautlense]